MCMFVSNLRSLVWGRIAGWMLFQCEILRLNYVIEEKYTGPASVRALGPKVHSPAHWG